MDLNPTCRFKTHRPSADNLENSFDLERRCHLASADDLEICCHLANPGNLEDCYNPPARTSKRNL